MSVNSYISDERKQASLDFIKWFAQEVNPGRMGQGRRLHLQQRGAGFG